MPLPSHAQRKKLAAVKAAAAKVSKIQKRPPHKPSPTSPVLQLSGDLSDAGRVWWNPYIGKTFLEWKKNRGNKYGAKGTEMLTLRHTIRNSRTPPDGVSGPRRSSPRERPGDGVGLALHQNSTGAKRTHETPATFPSGSQTTTRGHLRGRQYSSTSEEKLEERSEGREKDGERKWRGPEKPPQSA